METLKDQDHLMEILLNHVYLQQKEEMEVMEVIIKLGIVG